MMVLMMMMMTMMILMMPGAMTVTVVMISPSGREFPRRNLPARKLFYLYVVSVAKRRRKTSTKWLLDEISSRGVSTPKGCRRGCLGPPKVHQAWPRGAALGGPLAAPGSPLAVLRAPLVISDETSFSDFPKFSDVPKIFHLIGAFSSRIPTLVVNLIKL